MKRFATIVHGFQVSPSQMFAGLLSIQAPIFTSSNKVRLLWQFVYISISSWHLYAANLLVYYFPLIYSSLNSSIGLQFVAAETNWISNILALFTFNTSDQDHDPLFSSIMSKNIDNQIPIAFDQATPFKIWSSPSTSIIEKESYKDKKCDQLATNLLTQELLHEIKHCISCLQQGNKTDYMNEYIKAMQNQIASLKSEIMFLRREVKEKKTH